MSQSKFCYFMGFIEYFTTTFLLTHHSLLAKLDVTIKWKSKL